MKKFFFVLITILFGNRLTAQDSIQPCETLLKEYPILWQQQSAEYRALCYQAFNTAELQLKKIVKGKKHKKDLAIITDIDETILDNSYLQAKLIKKGLNFTEEYWKQWTNRSEATAVPGAIEFLQMAKRKRINIFYISNRDTDEVKTTLTNLQKLNLPDADTAHMLFESNTSSKEIRRQAVMKNYKVVMLLGDNLNDFTRAFEKKSDDDRKAETDKVRDEWGKKFIVLPNSSYGEWENAIYDYERNLTPEQKESKRIEKLKVFSVVY